VCLEASENFDVYLFELIKDEFLQLVAMFWGFTEYVIPSQECAS